MTTEKALKKEIVSIRIVADVDTDPDLSWLGEYSNKPAAVHIDREKRGDMNRGEYRYFNMSSNYEGEKPRDQKKYMEQDYKRMESYNAGHWCMIGIWAEAKICVGDTLQLIRSGGLWGIESDSDDGHKAEVGAAELSALADQLESLGFSSEAIEAVKPETTEPEQF